MVEVEALSTLSTIASQTRVKCEWSVYQVVEIVVMDGVNGG